MVDAWVLVLLVLSGLFALGVTPYDPTIAGRDKGYLNGAPAIPKFCDDNGCSARPFVCTVERTRSIKTNSRRVTTVNTEKRQYVELFVKGAPYTMLGIPLQTHLFGLDNGNVYLFGTDTTGKDIFSRTFHAINTSLAIGTIGVFIAFVLALNIGGISGYYGGWIDSIILMVTDAVRTIPAIPPFMALVAFIPDIWSAEDRLLFISIIRGSSGGRGKAQKLEGENPLAQQPTARMQIPNPLPNTIERSRVEEPALVFAGTEHFVFCHRWKKFANL